MNFTKLFAVIVGVMSMFSIASAQSTSTLNAVLKDENGEPVPFATVSITKPNATKPYKYALSAADGKVLIEKVAHGKYVFKAELLGYKEYVKDIEVRTPVMDLGTVKMEEDKEVLDAASISATGNPIIIKKDTVEYNASSFKTTENDMLVDLLKKLPGIEVGDDGTITANGETISKITIGNKTFFLDDPQLASQNLPAKIIEKIKVVRKKSEQAEFTGIEDGNEEQVIDLSVKKGMMNGLMGNFSAGGGHDLPQSTVTAGNDDFRYQGGAFIGRFNEHSNFSLILNANNTNGRGFTDISGNMMGNMRGGGGGGGGFGGGSGITRSFMTGLNGAGDLFDEKMNIGGNYVYNNTHRDVLTKTVQETPLGEDRMLVTRNGLVDPGFNTTANYGHRIGMRLDHKFTENTSILFQPSINFGGGNYTQFSDFETNRIENGTSNLTSKGFSGNSGDNRNWNAGGFLLFRQRLGMPGRTLSFMGNFNFSNNKMDGFNQSLTDNVSDDTQRIVNQRIDQYSKGSSLSGRLVYTEPLGGGFYASANYSYSWSRNESVKDAYDSGSNLINGNSLIYNPSGEKKSEAYSSSILNRYDNQSAGVDLQYQKDKMHAQVGLSLMPQKTHNETNDEVYNSKVLNFAPSAMVWYDMGETSNVRFFYRGRSSQPSTTQLMRVPDNSNPRSISSGNPALVPYFNHNMNGEFRMTNRKTFTSVTANINGGFVHNPIINAIWVDKDGVSYSIPYNGPDSFNGGARISVNSPIAKSNFSIFSMTNARYSQSTSFTDSGAEVSMDRYIDSDRVFKFKEFLADYPDPAKAPMFMKNITRSTSFTERLRFTYRSDNLEIMAGGRVSYSSTKYSINQDRAGQQKNGVDDVLTWNNSIDGSINWTLPAGFTFKTDARYNWYIGYTTPIDPTVIVNLDIQKLLFKNRVTLAVRAYDLLDQARTISESVSNGVRTERWSNTLGRYVIVALTYRFGTFGKRGNNMRMGPGMGGPGGPGGGPGRGGFGGGRPPMF
jgi:hypothetical protein